MASPPPGTPLNKTALWTASILDSVPITGTLDAPQSAAPEIAPSNHTKPVRAAQIVHSPPPPVGAGAEDKESTDPGLDDCATSVAAAVDQLDVSILKRARSVSLNESEKARLNGLLDVKESVTLELPFQVTVTLLPGVKLATGQASKGMMAQKARGEPSSNMFIKEFKSLLVQAAGCTASSDFAFIPKKK